MKMAPREERRRCGISEEDLFIGPVPDEGLIAPCESPFLVRLRNEDSRAGRPVMLWRFDWYGEETGEEMGEPRGAGSRIGCLGICSVR